MSKITIMLVDDHKLIRETWSLVLNSDTRFKVVAQTSSGKEAIAISKSLHPDIVLMDVNMTPVNGFDATKMILKYSPTSKVIGITMHSMPAYAKQMLQAGAMGYVTKNSSKSEMIKAILDVKEGKNYICNEVKDILVRQEIEGGKKDQPDMNLLSRRELEILNLIRDSASSREIAGKLNLSLKTVEAHRYNILKKLNLRNTLSLINFINSQGL